MNFCLIKEHAENFKSALRDGTIDPEKMADMTSEERRVFLENIVGKENAKDVNSLFEQKLLAKNQMQGIKTWAETVLGMRPKAKRDLLSRIERMKDGVLTAENKESFLQDLAEQKLGVGVNFDEAQKITELSANITKTRTESEKAIPDVEDWSISTETPEQKQTRLEYGQAQVELQNYVKSLKEQPSVWGQMKNPVTFVAGTAKSIQASMDNSAIFRQGWRTLWTHPKIWAKNAIKSFSDLTTYRNQESVLNNLDADIMSRPTYDLMKKGKLDIGISEEDFPSSLPEKVPVLGKVYKASENAYTAFVRKTRADVFDKYIEIARKNDVELTPEELQSIGKMVNALTGRGDLGSLERAGKVVNTLFFSPKFVKSHFDVLTQPVTGAGGSSFVRKQAAVNLVKIISAQAAIMAIAKATASAFNLPDPIELDPRSADFGKIKIGNTRFDISGGMASMITLAARLATYSTKSSVTDKVSSLNETDKNGKPKFGSRTASDVAIDFITNKLSPAGQVLNDLLKGETRSGEKPTVWNEVLNLVTPLPIKNAIETYNDPNSAPLLAAMLADFLGISTNTYGGSKDIQKQIQDAEKRGDKESANELRKILKEQLEIEKQKEKTNRKTPQEIRQDKIEKREQKIEDNKLKNVKPSKFVSIANSQASPEPESYNFEEASLGVKSDNEIRIENHPINNQKDLDNIEKIAQNVKDSKEKLNVWDVIDAKVSQILRDETEQNREWSLEKVKRLREIQDKYLEVHFKFTESDRQSDNLEDRRGWN